VFPTKNTHFFVQTICYIFTIAKAKSMNSVLLISLPGGSEWLIIAFFVLIFFGAKKIPEFAKGIGKGIKEFKDAMKDVKKEVDDAGNEINRVGSSPSKSASKIEEGDRN
jgi:sec-independent protein translocase protein TatA